MKRAQVYGNKCCVPNCSNTATKNPEKQFINVGAKLRKMWCERLSMKYIPDRNHMICCEDHLNFEEDLENYHYWRMMPNVKAKLKATALPRVKDVQATCNSTIISATKSSQNMEMILQPIENLKPTSTSASTHPVKIDVASQTNIETKDQKTMHAPMQVDVAAQTHLEMSDRSTSMRVPPQPREVVLLQDPHSDSQASSLSKTLSSPSFVCRNSDNDSALSILTKDKLSAREITLELILKNPKEYLGLPKQYLWLIDYILAQNTESVSKLDIIITLIKIKLNDPVHRICDHFMISRPTFSQIFYRGIKCLANFFQNLIFMPSLLQIKKNQPLAFKIRYSNVTLLLDAFEIEIEKPHNPVRQAQTWSQYKNANTVKYLIGSTPNGLVTFISKGYGGRISDKALVEKSGLLEALPFNSIIMADRGFKELEPQLASKGIKLLRPPSVYAAKKPTKEEVMQSKIIASLRVHIERVIRRVREFRLLKPHSVVSHKHVGYLDHVVTIACGLINLQDEIIKSE